MKIATIFQKTPTQLLYLPLLLLLFVGCTLTEPSEDADLALENTIVFEVFDAHDVDKSQNDFVVTLKGDDGFVQTYSSDSGTLVLDADDLCSGEYRYSVAKAGFMTESGEFVLDKEVIDEESTLNVLEQVYLNRIGGTFVVKPDEELRLTLYDGTMEVYVPAGAVDEEQEISIVKIASPLDRNEFDVIGNQLSLGGLQVLPEGIEFFKEITISLPLDSEEGLKGGDLTSFTYGSYDSATSLWDVCAIDYTSTSCNVKVKTGSCYYYYQSDYEFCLVDREYSPVMVDVVTEKGEGVSTSYWAQREFESYTGDALPEKYLTQKKFNVRCYGYPGYYLYLKAGHTNDIYTVYKKSWSWGWRCEKIGRFIVPSCPQYCCQRWKRDNHGGCFQ